MPSNVSSYRFAFVVFHERIYRRRCDRQMRSLGYSLLRETEFPLFLSSPGETIVRVTGIVPDSYSQAVPSLLISCRRTRHPVPDLRQGGCGCNHGSQCTRHHGQGRTEEADREHEVSGVHGTVAPVEKHRGVSASRHQANHHRRRCRRCLHPLELPVVFSLCLRITSTRL